MLSERAKQLIPKARIVSFEAWQGLYPETVLEIFQTADDQGRYLTDDDLVQLSHSVPGLSSAIDQAKYLRDQAEGIVQQSREQVLATFPGIVEPGGDLYPPMRAEACWRDFWHFLRCITYGVAGQRSDFTSPIGLKNMQLLYQELQVPIAAMICGLENLKLYSLELFLAQDQAIITPYFDHLIAQMKQFN